MNHLDVILVKYSVDAHEGPRLGTDAWEGRSLVLSESLGSLKRDGKAEQL